MLRYLPFLLVLALWIYAFIDCLNTPEEEVRGLPKLAWVFVILLFGEVLIGPVAWLVAGRPRRSAAAGGPARWVAPDDNPEFLKSLKDDKARSDEQLLKNWENDLRRREEELKRRESGEDPKEG
ncbi:PLD nuclease N-terminal domain-containing protein [Streptomyces sp. NPDC002588]|uniref:PLD nuclease N-terminal domain-containing protein n=1 Tax=Streptomyces sp. NPDC002588 TaxID=3154419 RepID=UPI0033280DC8